MRTREFFSLTSPVYLLSQVSVLTHSSIVEYATKEQAQHASRMLDHRMLMGHHVAVLQVRKLAEADDAVQVALTQPFSGPDQKVVGKLKICLAPNRSLISHVVEVREAKQFTWEM